MPDMFPWKLIHIIAIWKTRNVTNAIIFIILFDDDLICNDEIIPTRQEIPIIIVKMISISEYSPLAISERPKRKSHIINTMKNQKIKIARIANIFHDFFDNKTTTIAGIS
jgi:hypothetical protein